MKTSSVTLLAAILAGLLTLQLGCATDRHGHEVGASQPADGKPVACRLCYDESVKILKSRWPKAVQQGKQYETIKRHQCPDCGQLEFYAQDGKPMIKCARCAPNGLPCDRCLPPNDKH